MQLLNLILKFKQEDQTTHWVPSSKLQIQESIPNSIPNSNSDMAVRLSADEFDFQINKCFFAIHLVDHIDLQTFSYVSDIRMDSWQKLVLRAPQST